MSAADASTLDAVIAIARAAGAEILRVYRATAGAIAADRKSDGSPVTEADHAAERVIVAGLRDLVPALPVLAEELAARGEAPDVTRGAWWCVDPLDGTKDFLARTGDFVVCIGRIENGAPTLGVVHAPERGVTYAGAGPGSAIKIEADGTRRAIAVRAAPASPIALDSRSHRDGGTLDRWLAEHGVTERREVGSALKFGLVAEGTADLYVRFGPTSEWDTAAGHAVLEAAGGTVRLHDGGPLRYGKPGFLNPGFIARGRAGRG